MKSLTFLGIGSNSFDNLSTVSFALQTQSDKYILVDCGPDIPRQLHKAGISFVDVETVVLTHRHLDHCLGLPYFLYGRNLELTAKSANDTKHTDHTLRIIAEPVVSDRLTDLLHFCHPDVSTLACGLDLVNIVQLAETPLILSGFKISSYAMDHAVPTYGLKITTDQGWSLAYSSDTLPTTKFMEAALGVDVLIYEAMTPAADQVFSRKTKHSTGRDAGEAVKTIDPKTAYIVHLRPMYWHRRAEIEAEATSFSGLNTKYPKEGQKIVLT